MHHEDHPLARAINKAIRTMQPVTLTVEEAEQCYRELRELRKKTRRPNAYEPFPWYA